MPRKKPKKAEKAHYTGNTTPTILVSVRHRCHIPRTAKHGHIYSCICGKKFRFNEVEGLGVEL